MQQAVRDTARSSETAAYAHEYAGVRLPRRAPEGRLGKQIADADGAESLSNITAHTVL